MLAVALLECGEERAAERLAPRPQARAPSGSTSGERTGPIGWFRPATMLPMSMPGRRCLDQHPGVDRRVEQGELADHPLDVHAVADLEQPVGHYVPVRSSWSFGGNAEVKSAADPEQRAASIGSRRADPAAELRS